MGPTCQRLHQARSGGSHAESTPAASARLALLRAHCIPRSSEGVADYEYDLEMGDADRSVVGHQQGTAIGQRHAASTPKEETQSRGDYRGFSAGFNSALIASLDGRTVTYVADHGDVLGGLGDRQVFAEARQ